MTDEFIAHLRAQQAADPNWELSQTSEFLLVAATLLDLKAARLLPRSGDLDDDDLALIEARDLLFARLLQYRAYKEVAAWCADRMAVEGRIVPRAVGLEPQFAQLLPELVLGITPEQLALIAAAAMRPRTAPTVGVEHLHVPRVSVREQSALLVDRLRQRRVADFRQLVEDAGETAVVVARFLALLDLFRRSAVLFDQVEALGELTVRWTGPDEGEIGGPGEHTVESETTG